MPEILKSTLVVAREKMNSYSSSTNFGKMFLGTIEPAEPLSREKILEEFERVLRLSTSEIDKIASDEELFWTNVNELALAPLELIGEYKKHCVAYFLRDQASMNNKNAIKVLENLMKIENRGMTTDLLRHEVAFIFGQVYEYAQESGQVLSFISKDDTESPIVRHEVIMALENITGSRESLKFFLTHENQVIRESAEVALNE